MKFVSLSALPPALNAACLAAIKTSANSYNPYSNFSVGAALVHPDGTVTSGTNWENCTYQGTCAERCAIVTANALGKRVVTAVAVYGAVRGAVPKKDDFAITTPCGLCRQMLHEVGQISGNDLDVLMVTRSQSHVYQIKLSSLLPSSFGPEDAGLDISKFKVEKDNTSSSPSTKTTKATSAKKPRVAAKKR